MLVNDGEGMIVFFCRDVTTVLERGCQSRAEVGERLGCYVNGNTANGFQTIVCYCDTNKCNGLSIEALVSESHHHFYLRPVTVL